MAERLPLRVPEKILTEIRTRTSIAEVVSGYLSLRRAGRNYVALCPFHSEDTPSFYVNEERGFFHCFGCGAGGDVFHFLMRMEGISFPEAVRRVAARLGIPLPALKRDPKEKEREALYQINSLAASYFRHSLWNRQGEEAQRYLASRGLSRETSERFSLGYAPPREQGLVSFLREKGTNLDQAVILGLLGRRRDGKYYDRFRHRLIFPITDVSGHTIGFGGRILPFPGADDLKLPKYLNSPDSPLYKKKASLYGLFQAKEAMARTHHALVVEGYIDTLVLAQNGFPETVAVLGTALSLEQLRLIGRFAQDITVFFDGDAAGERAALRSFPLCLESGLWAKGAFLPQGYDPDSFVRAKGRDEVEKLLSRAAPLADFYLDHIDPGPKASVSTRIRVASEMATLLRKVKDPFAFDLLVRQAAQRLGVGEEVLRSPTTPQEQRKQQWEKRNRGSAQEEAELGLLELTLTEPQLLSHLRAEEVLPLLQTPIYHKLMEALFASWEENQKVDVGPILGRLPKEAANRVARRLEADLVESAEERQRFLNDCLTTLRRCQRQAARHLLRQELRRAEAQGDIQWKEVLRRWQELKAQEPSSKNK